MGTIAESKVENKEGSSEPYTVSHKGCQHHGADFPKIRGCGFSCTRGNKAGYG